MEHGISSAYIYMIGYASDWAATPSAMALAAVDSLKALDPKRPIREADIAEMVSPATVATV